MFPDSKQIYITSNDSVYNVFRKGASHHFLKIIIFSDTLILIGLC